MESHHVKSLSTDERSKNRLRFATSRQRSKRASADVYRAYKRQTGVTSAAGREEFVHNPQREESAKKRHRANHFPIEELGRTAVVRSSDDDNVDTVVSDFEELDGSTFASEVDIAIDRNACELFSKFHRNVWGFARSLPEILHHADQISDLLLAHMLSPASKPGAASDMENIAAETARGGYVVNHATTDLLHLLAVLARDLRHEIHPYLHEKIIPRIVKDLLNPPPPPPESGKQPIPLDVTIVEVAFRTLSYLFRYDSDLLLKDMEKMRQYYGSTLAHRRELVRRLAAETFAPLIRKMKSDSSRQRHIRRVLLALAASGDQPLTSSAKRTQTDAVDGISLLLFQIARGVSRRLHSKGSLIVKFLFSLLSGQSDSDSSRDTRTLCGDEIIFSVVSSFLDRLCYHLNVTHFSIVWDELVLATKNAVFSFADGKMEVKDPNRDAQFLPVLHMVKLMAQVASFRSGALLETSTEKTSNEILDIMDHLCRAETYAKIPSQSKSVVLSSVCSIWKEVQTTQRFATLLGTFLQGILASQKGLDLSEVASVRGCTLVLSEEFLPCLSSDLAVRTVVSEILSAAKHIADIDPIESLLVVFSIATTRLSNPDSADDERAKDDFDDDALFFPENGINCPIAATYKDALLRMCLFDFEYESISQDVIARLGVALRCAPFLALVGKTGEDEKRTLSIFKKTSNWILAVLKELSKGKEHSGDDVNTNDICVIESLAIESLSRLALSSFVDQMKSRSAVEKILSLALPATERLLFSNSGSPWAVKSVAAFFEVLQLFDKTVNDKANEMFDALMPNLRSPSHCLRLHTLEILVSYPQRPFVIDHADLDLEGDLDEEPSSQSSGAQESRMARGPSGLCDILETLLKIETVPVKFANERQLISLISRVEVLGRTGKLPVVYAEAAANCMLGIFHVKFSPMWVAAGRALEALATGHEDCVWPSLEAQLVAVMNRIPERSESEVIAEVVGKRITCVEHHLACLGWENSGGVDASILRRDLFAVTEEGRVSRHQATDGETVMESVWSVAERAPELLARHSRVIVPVFLSFLHKQYYFFHSNDPDSRELRLDNHVDGGSSK
jgi:hypothetical protein